MNFFVLTLFPNMFDSFLSTSLIQKAQIKKAITIKCIDYREYGMGIRNKVDSPQVGGGAGMVLRPEPIVQALEDINTPIHKILLCPQGKLLTQEHCKRFSKMKSIALVCGRYQGYDCRVKKFVDEVISVGEYILMGGEIAAMAIIEAVSRLIPKIIGNAESQNNETFNAMYPENDLYTKPYNFRGYTVPDVLTGGNHKKIQQWKYENSIQKFNDTEETP